MVSGIDDIDVAERIAGDPPRRLELAGARSLPPPLGKETAPGIELLNAIIAFVGHKNIADKIDRHATGEKKGPVEIETTEGPALISGDTLFPGGPGRSDSAEALRQMVSSIKASLLQLPPETVVYPGHGDNTTIADARREVAEFEARPHPADLHGDVTWAG